MASMYGGWRPNRYTRNFLPSAARRNIGWMKERSSKALRSVELHTRGRKSSQVPYSASTSKGGHIERFLERWLVVPVVLKVQQEKRAPEVVESLDGGCLGPFLQG